MFLKILEKFTKCQIVAYSLTVLLGLVLLNLWQAQNLRSRVSFSPVVDLEISTADEVRRKKSKDDAIALKTLDVRKENFDLVHKVKYLERKINSLKIELEARDERLKTLHAEVEKLREQCTAILYNNTGVDGSNATSTTNITAASTTTTSTIASITTVESVNITQEESRQARKIEENLNEENINNDEDLNPNIVKDQEDMIYDKKEKKDENNDNLELEYLKSVEADTKIYPNQTDSRIKPTQIKDEQPAEIDNAELSIEDQMKNITVHLVKGADAKGILNIFNADINNIKGNSILEQKESYMKSLETKLLNKTD
ncbi:transcription initiation factor TFIID subunit 1 isoform X3 [Eurytemora carolleeae]|uniref:transcription initiation factor TFIID subunit 1 isoform X3 n=1 Tax=Eurytemora carolleeae TaxID=1294199 RepID=UPI000C772F38|nr:transcription initiation factor TFIID subunit 1 isoform X3 [Eurytemora carolleeae]|eukprot:XP_023322344.1 transcription initiation factor TFIID subunit 1-like isoform X3 [Eurytemora affinis]